MNSLEKYLNVIDSHESQIQAFAFFDSKKSAQVPFLPRAVENQPFALQNCVIGVKDNIATADMPTGYGCAAYAEMVGQPCVDAAVVSRLKAQGASIVGKTVSTELAYLHPNKTHNPWNLAHTPGGSSSGSAAAVAAGMLDAALGTQTGGSIIRPAAFCGVVGFKPTRNVLPLQGVLNTSPTLDTVGVFARSVSMAAQVVGAVTDSSIAITLPEKLNTAPKLGVLFDLPWAQAEAAQKNVLQLAMMKLQSAGAKVQTTELPADCADAAKTARAIMAYEIAQHLQPLIVYVNFKKNEQNSSKNTARDNLGTSDYFLSSVTLELFEEGMALGEAAYLAALRRRAEIQHSLKNWLSGFDAMLSPPAPSAAPQGLETTGNPAFCGVWTLIDAPAISLPMSLDAQGMPLGLQLCSQQGTDQNLINVASWCEAVLGFDEKPRL